MFYRIAESADWARARETGYFASADLAAEGFIHGSELAQVLRTADKYYRGKTGLVLLEIDESLLDEPVVREDLSGSGILFPHSYVPIPVRAVARHFSFEERTGGGFLLPVELSN
ncbi:MAG: DUF952 domain-containing protein [Betaproteobacteria bacterium]|nr:DUF952 domain-containing protein [Betaproteobacteria bacterium]